MIDRVWARWVAVGLAVAIVIGSTASVGAYPQPSLVPESWQLDFECRVPRAIAVRTDEGTTRWYWYLAYQAENNSGDDQLFIPEVTVITDQGQIIVTDVGVPSKVFEEVRQRLRNPLLVRSSEVIGKILQGPDHAKDGVAIWAVPDEDVDSFSVIISGLSGETQKIQHPVTGEPVLLRKTLMIDYSTPGTAVSPQDPTIEETGRRWIMR